MKVWISLFFIFFTTYQVYSDAILKSRFIEVDSKNQIWIMRQNVSLDTNTYRLTSNELTYHRREKRFMARGNLNIFFKKENRKVFGDRIEKKAQNKIIYGNPIRVEDKNGSRKISSKILEIKKENNEEIMVFQNGVNIQEKDSNIVSEKMIYTESNGDITLQGKSSIEKPKDETLIHSINIKYNEKTEKAVFTEAVEIKRKKALIQGDKGHYLQKEDLIELTGSIKYKEKKRHIRSEKMFSEDKMGDKVFTFQKNVKIEEDDFTGECDQVEFFEKKDLTHLKGGAHLKDEKKKLQIKSSMMTIDNKKEMIYFLGRVYIKQKDKILQGNMGVYDKKTEGILLKGSPIYQKGSDITRAEIILLDTKTNTVKMKGNIRGSFRSSQESVK